jgi:hypothetical protein
MGALWEVLICFLLMQGFNFHSSCLTTFSSLYSVVVLEREGLDKQ